MPSVVGEITKGAAFSYILSLDKIGNYSKTYTTTGATLLTAADLDSYEFFYFNLSSGGAAAQTLGVPAVRKRALLIGQNSTNYPTFADQTYLQMLGPTIELKLNCVMELIWLGSKWLQGFTLVQ